MWNGRPFGSSAVTALVLLSMYCLVSVAASEDGSLPTSSIYMDSSPEPSASKDPYKNEHLLCDWMITASHCREADLTKRILIASMAMHCCVGFFGIWVMTYRSGGFSIAILKDLVDTGDGVRIRPKPLNCIVFFITLACFLKLAVNLPLVLERLQDKMWLRIALDQIYWVTGMVGSACYLVGMLYAIPMTRHKGIFAYYEPDLVPGSTKGYSIRVIYPSPLVRDLFLASSFLIPTIFCAGPAIASGVMHDLGHFEASEVLRTIRHINWVGIFYTVPVIAFYYSVKFALILWANIRLAESTLRVEPKVAFTIEYLLTMSPVRFLVILMTFTTFGAGAISIVCGSIVSFYLIYRHEILSSEHRVFAIGLSFLWTCLMGVGLFLELCIIALQSFRKKRRVERRLLQPSYMDCNPRSSDQTLPAHNNRVASYASDTGDSGTAYTGNGDALESDPYRYPEQGSETRVEILLLATPAKVRTLENRSRTISWVSSGQNSFVSGSLSSYLGVERNAMYNTAFNRRYSTARSDSSSAAPSVESGDGGLFNRNCKEAHSRTSTKFSHMTVLEELSGGQDWREDGKDSKVDQFAQHPLLASDLAQQRQQHLQQTLQRQLKHQLQQRLQQPSEQRAVEHQRRTLSQSTYISEAPHKDRHRLQITTEGSKPAVQLKSPRRTKSFTPRNPALATVPDKSMVRQQRSLEHILMTPMTFGIAEVLCDRQQQDHHQNSARSVELQLRQQHPQHKVAFKGLSPPPRSPTNPTEVQLALGPWSSLDAHIAMQHTPRTNRSVGKALIQSQSLGDIRSSLFCGVGDHEQSNPHTLRFGSEGRPSTAVARARSNNIDTSPANIRPKRLMTTPISQEMAHNDPKR